MKASVEDIIATAIAVALDPNFEPDDPIFLFERYTNVAAKNIGYNSLFINKATKALGEYHAAYAD